MNDIAGPAAPSASITPSPYVNRCALSEAWYRALYGTHQQTTPPPSIEPRLADTTQALKRNRSAPEQRSAQTTFGRTTAATAQRQRPAFAAVSAVRVRADRLAPARPGVSSWRAGLARRTAGRFSLAGGGSVDLLLLQRGRRLHVVAVATGAARDTQPLRAALSRARAALAAHGLRLDIDVREKGSA